MSFMFSKRILAAGAAALVLFAAAPALRSDSSNFPVDYRQWIHVKSVIIGPSSPFFAAQGGIHHVYANPAAFQGLRNGDYSDGSVLVFELLTLNEKDGASSEGARRRVDVMIKDSRANPATGGWRFDRFMGDDRSHSTLTDQERADCFTCHSNAKDRGSVFSRFRN
jgi:hypothetical protein